MFAASIIFGLVFYHLQRSIAWLLVKSPTTIASLASFLGGNIVQAKWWWFTSQHGSS
jgi:hypothetical protein